MSARHTAYGSARAAWFLDRASAIERGLSFAAFLVMISVVFLDVVSREVVGAGFHWAMQIGVYANYVVVMLGFGLASAGGTHLRPRFADRWLPRAWDTTLNRLQDGLMAVSCVGFAVLAALVVHETRMLGDRSAVLGNLEWPLQVLMPLVFVTAAVRHGLYAAIPSLRPADPGEGEGAASSTADHGGPTPGN